MKNDSPSFHTTGEWWFRDTFMMLINSFVYLPSGVEANYAYFYKS